MEGNKARSLISKDLSLSCKKSKLFGVGRGFRGSSDRRQPFRKKGVKTLYGVPSPFFIVQGSHNNEPFKVVTFMPLDSNSFLIRVSRLMRHGS